MEERIKLDISIWAIAKTIVILLIFYFLFLIRDILALFFFVTILVATFNPVINRWEKKMNRSLAVVLMFAIILLISSVVIYLVVPPVVAQFSQLVGQLPVYSERFDQLRDFLPAFEKNLSNISQSLTKVTENLFSITAGIFGGIITLLMAFVLTAYLLIDKEGFSNFVVSLFPVEQKDKIVDLFNKIGQKLGSWFRGQLLLGGIIALIDLVGLLIIGIPFALVLAVISGILELVPTIGPIIAGVLAAAVAFTESPLQALLIIVFYFAVQQLESAFIVPKVMQKAVGLSPVIVIFAFLVGAKLFGLVGAILAVPLAASISVVAQEWPTVKRSIKKP
ncbi:MAG: AI-2E family transporter [Patescibacteria group bacterium]|jgi:predicted PurR-regulated permease PerM